MVEYRALFFRYFADIASDALNNRKLKTSILEFQSTEGKQFRSQDSLAGIAQLERCYAEAENENLS